MVVVGFVVVAALFAAPAAQATFPGTNGKLAFYAFNFGNVIETINSDGSGGLTGIGGGPCKNQDPVWSPDGSRIAYAREFEGCTNDWDIAIMNADGTGSALVTGAGTGVPETDPTWSPDGTKIAFVKNSAVWVVSASGGTATQLSNPNTGNGEEDREPDWSPDGSRIAFQRFVGSDYDLYLMNADGSNEGPFLATVAQEEQPSWNPSGQSLAYQRSLDEIYVTNVNFGGIGNNVTNSSGTQEWNPVWSPDGKKIAFNTNCCELQTINSDGSGRLSLNTNAWAPDWQRLTGYIRPAASVHTRYGLVPAFNDCQSSNGVNANQLPSCVPPTQSSDYLTIGTPDVNGQQSKSSAYAKLDTVIGIPSTPADEADMNINVSVLDVRWKSNLTDYNGQLSFTFDLKRTSKENRLPGSSSYTLGGTVVNVPMVVNVPCTTTPGDSTVGSTCAVTTTADGIAGNIITEGKRTIWQMDTPQVFDGGADGNPSTGPNTLFEEGGNFIP
jgi:Tol biopolymer transport system component